jgi:hypothetical protein
MKKNGPNRNASKNPITFWAVEPEPPKQTSEMMNAAIPAKIQMKIAIVIETYIHVGMATSG